MKLTRQYWDCECKQNYIHPDTVDQCPKCERYAVKGADSLVSEVEAAGFPIDRRRVFEIKRKEIK